MTNRDSLKCVRDCLFSFTTKWRRLTDQTQGQIVWFFGELLKLGPNPIIHELLPNLFRNIAPGDPSPRNVWLADALLQIFIKNRAILDRQPYLVDCIVYCYLSIIIDHTNASVPQELRKKEINFVVSLLREKWDECANIGRDLVRLLHCVARIPEFESIWHDLLYSPSNLSPNFGGLIPLLRRRTSRRFLLLRITPDLEQKFFFVTSKVRMSGPYMRHLDWLKRCICSAQGPTLRCELIRYICGLIHPSMETINSDIIQRWFIIGWLLRCNPNANPGDIALARLALFFDWIGFDPAQDNVMNIEPGVLLIFHSKPPQSPMASTLLDFLCKIVPSFHPPASEDIRQGILAAFRHLQEKRVVPLPNIGLLFDQRILEPDVYFACRQMFPELLPQQQAPPQSISEPQARQNHSKFSDDEFEEKQKPVAAISDELPFKPFVFVDEEETLDDLEEKMADLDSEIAQAVREIAVTSDSEQRCTHVETVLQQYHRILAEGEDDSKADKTIRSLPDCLLSSLRLLLLKSPLPSLTATNDQLEESLSAAYFVIFNSIVESNLDDVDPARSSYVSLVASMSVKQGRIVGHFLYFLAVRQAKGEITSKQSEQLVRELTEASRGKPTMEALLMGSIEFLQETDPNLFCYLLPFLYTNFKRQLFDPESPSLLHILHLTVQCCDASQLAYLSNRCLMKHLSFFNEQNVCSMLQSTLQWESVEQVFVWQLLFSHSNIQLPSLFPILRKLKPDKHHEALLSLCNRFALSSPTQESIAAIFSRPPAPNELMTSSLLRTWYETVPDKLVESLQQALVQQPPTAIGQRGRGPAKPARPPGQAMVNREQFLAHLDRYRLICDDVFLRYPPVQRILSQMEQIASEHVRNK